MARKSTRPIQTLVQPHLTRGTVPGALRARLAHALMLTRLCDPLVRQEQVPRLLPEASRPSTAAVVKGSV